MSDDTDTIDAPTSIIQISAFDPDARENPHPRLKALRETCPVMRDEAVKTWLLTRYEDIRATVNDRTFVRQPSKAEEGSMSRMFSDPDDPNGRRSSILFQDDPDHSRNRLPLVKAFYARIKKMEPEIEAMIDQVIDQAPASGRFDLMEHIAVPIPILIIAHILGVDESRLPEFRDWSEGVILSLNPMRTEEETAYMEASGEKLEAYFAELMEARRKDPKDDLISDMVQAQAEGGDFEDDELRINLQALLVGGNLTTTDLIGNGVWLFLTHPQQLAALKADPSLGSAAVEEVLRYEAPGAGHLADRFRGSRGCRLSDEEEPAGLHVAGGGQSRSGEIRRAGSFRHYGEAVLSRLLRRRRRISGIGAPLARIEARRVYQKLFQRYPNMRLANQDIVWRSLPFFRGIETLEVEV